MTFPLKGENFRPEPIREHLGSLDRPGATLAP